MIKFVFVTVFLLCSSEVIVSLLTSEYTSSGFKDLLNRNLKGIEEEVRISLNLEFSIEIL